MAGSIALTFALMSAVAAVVFYYMSIREKGNYIRYARISFYLSAVLILAASMLLLNAILSHNYEYKYVYEYSGSGLSIGLLISTFYAGQEGSFLLWTLFVAVAGLILENRLAKGSDIEQSVMTVYSLAMTFLLIMISPLLKNPFAYIWTAEPFVPVSAVASAYYNLPYFGNYLFTDNSTGEHFIKITSALAGNLKASGISINQFITDGRGLNPLLQNFWMQIHPPILFVGFALSLIPFAFASGALIEKRYSNNWVKAAFPWVVAGNMMLGLALMLGGYWAYGVLGWGGYWGWDPVENSSLVPWLVGAALLHTMLIQRKDLENRSGRAFARTNIILSMSVFWFVLYSTFLTRSGILGDASVHSFTDPGSTVYVFLVVFLSAFVLLGLGLFFLRRKNISDIPEAQDLPVMKKVFSRESGIFFGAAVLLAISAIVIAGTSSPIFGISVDTSFYSNMSLPLGILMTLLNALSIFFRWGENKSAGLIIRILPYAAAAVLITIVIVLIGEVNGIALMLLVFSSSFAFVSNAGIMFRMVRNNASRTGAYVSHIGVAVFLAGVAATSGLSSHSSVDLPRNSAKNVLGYTLTYKGYEQHGEKYRFMVEVRKGDTYKLAAPVMYVSRFNNGLMREPDILAGLRRDLYISPVSYEDGSQNAVREVTLTKGESTEFAGSRITFVSFDFPREAMNAMMSGAAFDIGATLEVEKNGNKKTLQPKIRNQNGQRSFISAEDDVHKLSLTVTEMDASGKIRLSLSDMQSSAKRVQEVLSVEASIKPFVSFVWIGVFIAIAGYVISLVRRMREQQK